MLLRGRAGNPLCTTRRAHDIELLINWLIAMAVVAAAVVLVHRFVTATARCSLHLLLPPRPDHLTAALRTVPYRWICLLGHQHERTRGGPTKSCLLGQQQARGGGLQGGAVLPPSIGRCACARSPGKATAAASPNETSSATGGREKALTAEEETVHKHTTA